jgi:DNA topoisomerase-1
MIIYRFTDGEDSAKKPLFIYKDKSGDKITDNKVLEYVVNLRIPPAWKRVEIDYKPDVKQTVKGYDEKDRMQCLYSNCHIKKARRQKYCDLINFGLSLPKIESDVTRLINNTRLSKDQVIALILRVISRCSFRLGNIKYEKQNASYGITTIRKKHITIKPNEIIINFVGKKGVINNCVVNDAEATKLLTILYDAKKEDDHIMMYIDPKSRQWTQISHLDINNFLKQYNPSITSKDFRTYQSNILLINSIRKLDINLFKSGTDKKSKDKLMRARKKSLISIIKEVSEIVHNTPAICKKDYMDSDILDLFIEKPISYKAKFITPGNNTRTMFVNWLKKKCDV